MFSQYGELRPISGWDRSGSLGHPCKFQRVLRLGSVTARHSTIGRQPKFAALNRGRHLYSAGRLSRWALDHIVVLVILMLSKQATLLSYGNIWFVILPAFNFLLSDGNEKVAKPFFPLAVPLQYTQGNSDVISSYHIILCKLFSPFTRHDARQALRNVCYCDITFLVR